MKLKCGSIVLDCRSHVFSNGIGSSGNFLMYF